MYLLLRKKSNNVSELIDLDGIGIDVYVIMKPAKKWHKNF